jgi:hypothetical protein
MPADPSPQLPSLGDAALHEGEMLGRMNSAGMTIRYESAACTCGGENENCFKCDGTGYYRRQMVEVYLHGVTSSRVSEGLRRMKDGSLETTFSNDGRGGDYGVREKGRFSSNPLHDDHDS